MLIARRREGGDREGCDNDNNNNNIEEEETLQIERWRWIEAMEPRSTL